MASKNRYFADDGWAFWVTGDDTSTIYLNDWINPKGKSYVDIGVRVLGVSLTDEMNIYVPFRINRADIEDISGKLQDSSIFRAVFNATGIMDIDKNEYTSEMAYHGKAVDLVHLSRVNFTVSYISSGTLITIPITDFKDSIDNDEAYFLFRIPHVSLDRIFAQKINIGNFFTRLRDLVTTPVVAEKYGYSVRINEARLLPDDITRMGAFHRQKLNKAVVTISVHEDYQLSDANCYRIHRLEETLYRDYAPKGYSCEDVITYQWNQNRDVNLRGQFNFYFDINREFISKSSMLFYMILLLFLGMMGDALWDLVCFLTGL